MPTGPLIVIPATALLVSAFASVFIAELAGDKTLYSVGALATRYQWWVVLFGIVPAVALKMLAAVSLGSVIGSLPPRVVAIVSIGTFVLAAVLLSRDEREHQPSQQAGIRTFGRGVWAGFAMIFFTEWGDPGQLATAALVARYGHPAIVWIGACSAMLVKSAVAFTVGIGLRRFAKPRVMRAAALAVCVLLAITTGIEHWR